MMATGQMASIALLTIPAILLLAQTSAAQRPMPTGQSSPSLIVTAVDQHRLLWTLGRPVLAFLYRVPSERINGHRQLLDWDSLLAHGKFNLRHDGHRRRHNHPYGERERLDPTAGHIWSRHCV
jgi:hypothetical protein